MSILFQIDTATFVLVLSGKNPSDIPDVSVGGSVRRLTVSPRIAFYFAGISRIGLDRQKFWRLPGYLSLIPICRLVFYHKHKLGVNYLFLRLALMGLTCSGPDSIGIHKTLGALIDGLKPCRLIQFGGEFVHHTIRHIATKATEL